MKHAEDNAPAKITKTAVKNLAWLAQRLPVDQQLTAGDVELIISKDRSNAVVTRIHARDILKAGRELKKEGQRIATLPVEIFTFYLPPGWMWFAMKQTATHAVELDEAGDEIALETLHAARFMNPNKLSDALGLLFGRHDYGVTTKDIDELSGQLLEARP